MSQTANLATDTINNETKLSIALVPIARPTFDIPLAEAVTAQIRTQLAQLNVDLIGPSELITSLEQAQEVGQSLGKTPLDLLLVVQATFADSTMIMELAQQIDAPLLMWAVPEAHTGGRLRLNSLCGINLAGHALTRSKLSYETLYAAPDDPSVLHQVEMTARAGRVKRRLQQARLGRLGEHPAGFDSCEFDAQALNNLFGLELVQLDLPQFFSQVKAVASNDVDTMAHDMGQTLTNLSTLDQTATRGTLSTYITLHTIATQEQLDGFAVRCWPEFFTELGCAACGAMSMLSNDHTPCSCEADVNGTITQLMLQWLSDQPAFGSDLVSIDAQNDALVLWHCGLAPLSMADPTGDPQATIHSNRKLPLLMEFPLKPGRVTIARLSEATGTFRLVIGGGEMIQSPPSFSGTSGLLRFDRSARAVLDTILSEGLEHHISITYGDYVPALLTLAKMLKIPVLRL